MNRDLSRSFGVSLSLSPVNVVRHPTTRAARRISPQVGIADYQELAKGQMLGGADGFLKLIFHTETLKLLGVHCIGDGATEIIHIGQARF